MKSLPHHLSQYIAARRALGTQLREPAKTLNGFIEFLRRKQAKFITVPLALEWSQKSPTVQRATWARKLSMVRQFARWLSVIDRRHQVPPPRLLNVRHRRSKPHIYSDSEIAQLIVAATALPSPRGMKGLTLGTVIGLLASAGLRPGEAAALEDRDVDFEDGVLVIRESKFGKSRHVPIHKSTVAALKEYARKRDRLIPHRCGPAFFVSDRGEALALWTVRRWFCHISRSCGIRKEAGDQRCGRGPRLQDLRQNAASREMPSAIERTIRMLSKSSYIGLLTRHFLAVS